jgi:hypothetical protein
MFGYPRFLLTVKALHLPNRYQLVTSSKLGYANKDQIPGPAYQVMGRQSLFLLLFLRQAKVNLCLKLAKSLLWNDRLWISSSRLKEKSDKTFQILLA